MRLSGGFARRVHAMLEHLKPCSSVGFTVEIQLLDHFTRKFDATKAARGNDILVSHGKLVDVEAFIPVIGDHGLQIVYGIARVPNVAGKSGPGNLQCRATNCADWNLLRVKLAKKCFKLLV